MNSYEVRTSKCCRFVAPESSSDGVRRVPFVVCAPGSPDELPCLEMSTDPARLAVHEGLRAESISKVGCNIQRELGLCPRGLGVEIPVELQPRC